MLTGTRVFAWTLKPGTRGFSSTCWVSKQTTFRRGAPLGVLEDNVIPLAQSCQRLCFSDSWKARCKATFPIESSLLEDSPEVLKALDVESERFLHCDRIGLLLPGDQQVTFVRDVASPKSGAVATVDLRQVWLVERLDRIENQLDATLRGHVKLTETIYALGEDLTFNQYIIFVTIGVVLGIVLCK